MDYIEQLDFDSLDFSDVSIGWSPPLALSAKRQDGPNAKVIRPNLKCQHP